MATSFLNTGTFLCEQFICYFMCLFFSGTDGAMVDIFNLVDITSTNNYEMAMRVNTDIQNKDKEFFVDLNGFQVHIYILLLTNF